MSDIVKTIREKLLQKLNSSKNVYKDTGRDVSRDEWGEPNGYYVYEDNEKIACDFKWLAQGKSNKKKNGITNDSYKFLIKSLVDVCKNKFGSESVYRESPNEMKVQKGMRIRIAETNDIGLDENKELTEGQNKFIEDICTWDQSENGLKAFMDIFKKLKEESVNIEQISSKPDEENKMEEFENQIKQLLENNHNIILHGAPGTGKTYLAKKIAKAKDDSDSEIGFVQFHQSFDYTDFVEGLRPKNKENKDGSSEIVFVPKDGIFKKFCEKALINLVASNKNDEIAKKEAFWLNKCKEYLGKIEDSLDSDSEAPQKNSFETKGTGNKFQIDVVDEDSITISIPNNSKRNSLDLKIDDLVSVLIQGTPQKVKDVRRALNRSRHRQIDSYIFVLVQKIIEFAGKEEDIKIQKVKQKRYIFIIDEINRGEMSKIFGELFYSIDPGYRVNYEDLKNIKEHSDNLTTVQTQYANLQETSNVFDKELGISDDEKDNHGHFFVPENVYIIGTMNDIDRSVESMDFAMRRRFAFKEVTAEQSQTMFGDGKKWKNGKGDEIDVSSQLDKIKQRMNNLNNAILNKDFNLNSSYQIGGAYFLKFANYCKTDAGKKAESDQTDAFNSLWTNHLQCILREYLRGMDNVDGDDGLLKKLEKAYNLDPEYKYNEKGEKEPEA